MTPNIKNALLALLITCGMFASFYYLERAFRGGDTRRAVEAVQHMKVDNKGQTILGQLHQEFGEQADLNWFAEIENTYKGLIRVYCKLPNQKVRTWRVNVLMGTVAEIS